MRIMSRSTSTTALFDRFSESATTALYVCSLHAFRDCGSRMPPFPSRPRRLHALSTVCVPGRSPLVIKKTCGQVPICLGGPSVTSMRPWLSWTVNRPMLGGCNAGPPASELILYSYARGPWCMQVPAALVEAKHLRVLCTWPLERMVLIASPQ